MSILAADGRQPIVTFLATPDPTAPEARSAKDGTSLGHRQSYGWRLLMGASDADGVLRPYLRDHFHNFWTHRGHLWVAGTSAAAEAERSFGRAKDLWASGDRAQATYWLGASVHLVQDACAPQHNLYVLGLFHHDYELWARRHQRVLAVASGGLYRRQFRTDRGHGGDDWSSRHPRGWVDECAHRSIRRLRDAAHRLPARSAPTDAQWKTRDVIAAAQRLSAGYIAFFFEEVNGP